MKTLYSFWIKLLFLYWSDLKILRFNLSLRGKNPHKSHLVHNQFGLKFYIQSPHLKKKGVVIVEYVLLLVACVAIAIAISKAVQIGSNTNESGWFIKAWMNVLNAIAEDM